MCPKGIDGMKTERLDSSEKGIKRAGEILRNGGLVGIPTETVYGLAANALDGKAVAKIFKAKGRPMDNPLIVHISDEKQIYSLVREYPEKAQKLAKAYWPGALTIILPKADCIPDEVSAGLDTVAIRLPSHPVARAIICAAGVPLAAPSANSSGKPSPTTVFHVLDDIDGKIDAVLDGGECAIGVESTVISLAGEKPRLLRPGGVTPEQLEAVLGEIEIDRAVTKQLEEGQKVESPGMKYKHYAPNASVTIVSGSSEDYVRFVNSKNEPGVYALCFDEDAENLCIPFIPYGRQDDSLMQAQQLFDALRELDNRGAKKVYARRPKQDGVGLAVYNRILRAAGFSEIDAPKQRIIGITGPTGAGKSIATDVMRREGCSVIDADVVARELVNSDAQCLKALEDAFGEGILRADGTLDRKELARRAFSTKEKEKLLNDITHPLIIARIKEKADSYLNDGARCVIIDAPLLIESGCDKLCDKVLTVLCDEEMRCKRICERDNLSVEEAKMRISVQQNDEFYASRADKVFVNDGDLENFEKEVKEWLSAELD